ncbi:hypothetical protein [Burkholderia ubonensis]|uniref:hypothetical protein n=1 Tax=Burkholderia ubonensis TaxID=101571 RepID=UPI001E4ABBB2|nr:hypothetical protein [Burkholderia ubonensis]
MLHRLDQKLAVGLLLHRLLGRDIRPATHAQDALRDIREHVADRMSPATLSGSNRPQLSFALERPRLGFRIADGRVWDALYACARQPPVAVILNDTMLNPLRNFCAARRNLVCFRMVIWKGDGNLKNQRKSLKTNALWCLAVPREDA